MLQETFYWSWFLFLASLRTNGMLMTVNLTKEGDMNGMGDFCWPQAGDKSSYLPSDHFVSGNSRLFCYFHLSCYDLFFTARFLSSTDFGLKRGWFKPRITQLLFA